MTTYADFIEAKEKFLAGHDYTVEYGSICDGGIKTERYLRDDGQQFFIDVERKGSNGLYYTTYEYWSTTFDKSFYAHTLGLKYRLHNPARRA